MIKRFRARPLGWITAVSTMTIGAAMLAALLPSGAAAAAETTYNSSFEAPCVVAPGVLNAKFIFKISTTSTGPASVEPGGTATFTNTVSTIKTPPAAANAFAELGSKEVKGHIESFVADTTGFSPSSLNIAEPAAFPSGLPFQAPVVANTETTFTAPTGSSFSFGPLTVTGKAGTNGVLTVDTAPGFTEVENGVYAPTGEGIISSVAGYNSEGVKTVGPLEAVCNAPANVVLGSVPIAATTTTTTSSAPTTTTTTTTTAPTTTTTTSSTTTTTSKSTTTTTTTTKSAAPVEALFQNWVLSGSLTVKKLGEKITLPAGSTFNGKATIPGTLEGNTSVPPFKASVKLFSLLPTTLGITFTESGPATATVTPAAGGNLTIKGSAKDTIGITGVGLLGLNIPVSCTTSSPVTFPLEATLPATDLATGASFSGTTTLPSVNCTGGLLGGLFGSVITELLAGPGNAYTLTIAP
jgi:hypothetical protein